MIIQNKCVSLFLFQQQIKKTMAQRRTWTTKQDQALMILKDVRKIKKWSKISEILESEFGIIGRNGKQCRERYHNHLDNHIVKEDWLEEQNEKLVNLHKQLGNRWASIARELKGRTDNCVKNHFYSQFRKAIRVINDLIKKNAIKNFKPIKSSFIKQIIRVTENENRKEDSVDQIFRKRACELKDQMLNYSLISFQLGNTQSLNTIIQLYKQFQKNIDKNQEDKTKKESAIHTKNIFYSDDQNQSAIDFIKLSKEDVIFDEESSKNTPQTYNLQDLSLKGISSFLDQHLDLNLKDFHFNSFELTDLKKFDSAYEKVNTFNGDDLEIQI